MAVHVGESQHAKTLTFEPSLSYCVFLAAARQVVNATVDLDDEFGFQAHEIHDVRPDSSLPTEFGAIELPVPKALPQPALLDAWLFALAARELQRP